MPYELHITGGDLDTVGSTNVSALTYDALGNYLSGGIPYGCAVMQDTGTGKTDDVILATTGLAIRGICATQPAVGPQMACKAQALGIAICQASAAVTIGQTVYVANTSGQLGPVPALGATNVIAQGQALTAATQAGDLFSVQLVLNAANQVNA